MEFVYKTKLQENNIELFVVHIIPRMLPDVLNTSLDGLDRLSIVARNAVASSKLFGTSQAMQKKH
jgi:hypothetical protein